MNNLRQGEAGLEASYQENVTQISERQHKNASWKSLEGTTTLIGFFGCLFWSGGFFCTVSFWFWGFYFLDFLLILSLQFPPLSKNEVYFSSGISSDLFTHSYNHFSHCQEVFLVTEYMNRFHLHHLPPHPKHPCMDHSLKMLVGPFQL